MKKLSLLALLSLAILPPALRAEHATIDLHISRFDADTGRNVDEATANADQEPPLGGVNPRPLARVKAGESLALEFILTSNYPHGTKKDVTVRYFVVREEKVRQKTVPDLKDGSVTQGQFLLNLKPKGRVGARVLFTIPEPGLYLLRVETQNTDSDHEHFAAIDVQAE